MALSARRPAEADREEAPRPRPSRSVAHAAHAALYAAHERLSLDAALERLYPRDRAAMIIATKSTVNPARTDVADWAGALVQTSVATFLAGPGFAASAYARLSQRSAFQGAFGRGAISFPYRTSGLPFAAEAYWIGEGDPIPVGSYGLGSVGVSPRKAAAISTMTRELVLRTDAARIIEALMADDLATVVDTALLDGKPGTAKRPASLLYGLTPLTPSTATDPEAAARADIAALLAALGRPSDPVLIMPALQAFTAASYFPGWADRILASPGVPAGTVVAIDAARFASGVGGLEVEASEAATLVMSDTPTPIVDAGGALGAPTVSLFQNATIGLLTSLQTNWAMGAQGAIAFMEDVGW